MRARAVRPLAPSARSSSHQAVSTALIVCIGVFRRRILTSPCAILPAMDEWREIDGALERTFELPSFAEAIAFVNRVAELAEAAHHHPDLAVSYRRVTHRS